MQTWGLRAIERVAPLVKQQTGTGFQLAAGLSLGGLILVGWQQYVALWGVSLPVVVALALVAALGLLVGGGLARQSGTSLGGWLVACGLWGVIHPLWVGTTAETLLIGVARWDIGWGLALAAALLQGLLPVVFWTAAAIRLCQTSNTVGWRISTELLITASLVAGLWLTTFGLAPALGGEWTGWLWGALSLACGLWQASGRLILSESDAELIDPRTAASRWSAVRILEIGAVALAAAVVCRWVGELMPTGLYWTAGVASGLVLGLVLGRQLASRLGAGGAAVLAAAWVAVVLATESTQIGFCLWCSATFTTPAFLLPTRALFLTCMLLPLGISLGTLWRMTSAADLRPSLLLAGLLLAVVLCGWAVPALLWAQVGLANLAAVGAAILLLLGAVDLWLEQPAMAFPWKRWLAPLAFALALATPLISGWHVPGRTARLLYSTTVMVAQRSGWDSRWLPWLDDQRLLTAIEGQNGPWTLWRTRGVQVHLRESGMPRGMMSAAPELHPHYAPEVLQAAYPLVLAGQPQRVLVLGGTSRTVLRTCLEFPLTELTCVEGDPALASLSRGAWAELTGFHPEADDRFRWTTAAPELFVTQRSGDYDVILSCPPASMANGGTASFTREHYRHVAKCLQAEGVFCQRLEGIDYGPRPLQAIAGAMQQAFREVVLFEPVPGEYLLVATNSPAGLIRESLRERMEAPQVVRVLGWCGWDWSMLASLPAVDGPALREAVADRGPGNNTAANGWLAWTAAGEVMRWGNKAQEVHALLLKPRKSEPQYLAWQDPGQVDPPSPARLTRAARLLDWMGQFGECADVVRRIGEVQKLAKLVAENPDTFWWEYRKTLRDQLKNRPRAAIDAAAGISDGKTLHAEDLQRKAYLVSLGEAAQQAKPELQSIAAVADFFSPYDPLVSLCAHYEAAELYARRGDQPVRELALKLHVVNHSPSPDGSVRNVAECLKLLIEQPDAVAAPAARFDQLNYLVQLLRGRWDIRASMPARSYRMQVVELDTDVVLAERSLEVLRDLAPAAGLTTADWDARRTALDQIVVRPLRAYRTRLAEEHGINRMKTQELLQKAGEERDAELKSAPSAEEPSPNLPQAN